MTHYPKQDDVVMDNRTRTGLAKLPQFTISAPAAEGSDVVLARVFDHTESVRVGRAWLYRPNDGSLEGDLISVDADTGVARILVTRERLPTEFHPGASFPYFYGYFEPSVVDMILDPHRVWVRVKYEPTDSVRIVGEFPDGPLYGEIEFGAPIPSGFRKLATIPKGWSKESCELCQETIGNIRAVSPLS
jgi:hypothetical protein